MTAETDVKQLEFKFDPETQMSRDTLQFKLAILDKDLRSQQVEALRELTQENFVMLKTAVQIAFDKIDFLEKVVEYHKTSYLDRLEALEDKFNEFVSHHDQRY